MPTRIDEIESEVELQGESAQGGERGATAVSAWQALDRFRELNNRRARDDERTEAWDFDD